MKDWTRDTPYKMTPTEAATRWRDRFHHRALAMVRRHAEAFPSGPMQEYWREVARIIWTIRSK